MNENAYDTRPTGFPAAALLASIQQHVEPTDFLVIDHGPISALVAETQSAEEWVGDQMPEDRRARGCSTAVDPRDIPRSLSDIMADDLTVEGG